VPQVAEAPSHTNEGIVSQILREVGVARQEPRQRYGSPDMSFVQLAEAAIAHAIGSHDLPHAPHTFLDAPVRQDDSGRRLKILRHQGPLVEVIPFRRTDATLEASIRG
jgi:hypothetical protein